MLSQVAVLNDVSSNHVTLIDSNDVEISVLKLWSRLQVSAISHSLILYILKHGSYFEANIKADGSEWSFTTMIEIVFIVAWINNVNITANVVD